MRLYPTAEQAALIRKSIGCARFVYNHFLAKRIAAYKETGKGLSYKEIDAQLTHLKRHEETHWLSDVDKFALQQALRDLEKA